MTHYYLKKKQKGCTMFFNNIFYTSFLLFPSHLFSHVFGHLRPKKQLLRSFIAGILTALLIASLIVAPKAIYAQQNATNNNNEKETIEQERAEIKNSRDVILKSPEANKFENTDSSPIFSNAIDTLTKQMKKTIYKNLKCKEKFFSSFTQVKDNRTEVLDAVKKDLKCINLPNSFLLTAFNIYSKEKSLVDLQYLNTKLTSLNVPKYKFVVQRSSAMFKIKLVRTENSFNIVKGASDNADLTKIVREEGFEHYGEVLMFITEGRILMHLNIYNADSHRLIWKDKWSIAYTPQKVNFTVGLRINLNKDSLSFTSLTTSIYTHALRFVDLGFYFDFGFYNIPNKSVTKEQLALLPIKTKIHIGLSLGGLVAINLVESITGRNECCELAIIARPGILIDIPLIDFAVNNNTAVTVPALQTKIDFIIPVGLAVSLQDIFLTGEYYPLINMGSVSVGYKF